jgi:hypothetical protein
MPQARLTVPGFNEGKPLPLLDYALASGLRAAGGGRTGRLADWSGEFAVEDPELATAINDHIEHNFEEGHSAVSEIVEDGPDSQFKLEGVALRHRGGAKFGFDAFSRIRI